MIDPKQRIASAMAGGGPAALSPRRPAGLLPTTAGAMATTPQTTGPVGLPQSTGRVGMMPQAPDIWPQPQEEPAAQTPMLPPEQPQTSMDATPLGSIAGYQRAPRAVPGPLQQPMPSVTGWGRYNGG